MLADSVQQSYKVALDHCCNHLSLEGEVCVGRELVTVVVEGGRCVGTALWFPDLHNQLKCDQGVIRWEKCGQVEKV
jgi:hypothetical protein